MKKQILVFAALLVAVFFTACQQDALVEPIEDITQVEQSADPPQEAMDALETLIDSDFAEPELELYCNDDHFGLIGQGNPLIAGTLCRVKLAFYGGGNGSPTWFYYHVDGENTDGQYKLIDSDWKHGAFASWNYREFTNVAVDSSCKWRAYVYAWDASCGTSGVWKRLAVRYF